MYVVFATIATFVPSCVLLSRHIHRPTQHQARVRPSRRVRRTIIGLTSTVTSKSPSSSVALFR